MTSFSRRSFLKKTAITGLGASVFSEGGSRDLSAARDRVTFIITADLHAQLFTHDEFFWEQEKALFRKRGGLAVLKTMTDRLRKNYPNSLLIDAGDYFHGHAIATLTEGQALVPLMNAFNYDLLVPGNWEVVYRKSGMLRDLGAISAEKVCANMFHRSESGDRGDLIFRPWIVREIAGARIGIIGYTDHLTPRRQPPAFSKGIAFEHPKESLARHIKQLKEQERCGIIVLVTHIGLAQQVALGNDPACEGADLIIGADTHERVREPINCTYARVVECGAFGSFVGRVTLDISGGRMAVID
ncbi:MAG: metallophosphoesterase, partial [Bacteroidota bacterium]